MARPRAKAPSRTYHISGQSVVRIGSRDIYLGRHDSPESIARYAVLIGVYQANGLTLPEDFDATTLDRQAAALLGQLSPQAAASDQTALPITVKHVTASYREHIATKYAESATELKRLEKLCDELDQHDGDIDAAKYGPLRLQAQRQRWVASGKARVYCNRLTNSVKRMFKFAVSQELVPSSCWEGLRSVESLRCGQTSAHEKDAIGPVDIDIVRKTAKYLSPIIRAMVRVQVGTGMRPSEVCRMRPCEIDRSGDVWVYKPAKHKTANKGKTKAVPLVGDVRDAITDYLNRDPKSFCFSPAESVAWSRARRLANRKTPMNSGNKAGSNRKARPAKEPGDHYDHSSYRQAIHRSAKAAGVARWNPYQLRHLAATTIRDVLGVEAAQAALGHSHPQMTQHYAKQTLAKAVEAAQAAPRL